MSETNRNTVRKPYTISVIFEEDPKLFKLPIDGKLNLFQKMAAWASELVFHYLVLKGWLQAYIVTMCGLALIMFLWSVFSISSGVVNATITNYAYMFFALLVIPFLTYFLDVYQAMQLRRGMNLAIREKSYSIRTDHEDDDQINTGKFEWLPTNLAILNSIIQGEKRSYSYGDFGDIAGINRQTAAAAINKLLGSGLIYKENEVYYFSGVTFEVLVRKDGKLKLKELSTDEQKRLRYLFQIMCFVAF